MNKAILRTKKNVKKTLNQKNHGIRKYNAKTEVKLVYFK
ncbi:hypothetical protein ACVTMR_00580 [Escherichia coli]